MLWFESGINCLWMAYIERMRVEELKISIEAKIMEMKALEPTAEDEIIRSNAEEYENKKRKLEEVYETEREYRALEQKCLRAESNLQSVKSEMDAELKTLEASRKNFLEKAELLENVECIDKENAKCGFLKDAVSAKNSLKAYPEKLKEIEQHYSDKIAPIEAEISAYRQELSAIDYDSQKAAEISRQVQILKSYAVKLETLADRAGKRVIAAAQLENLKSNLIESEKRLNDCREKLTAAERERDFYKEAFINYEEVKRKVIMLKLWLDKERQIPVAEERKITALTRITEFSEKISDLEKEISDKQAEAEKETLNIGEIPELSGIVTNLDVEIEVLTNSAKETQMKIGALKQKAEQAESLKNKIAELQILKTETSCEQTDYEILENAFSQAGVPHQIIRSIIPKLKSAANSIIAQMTSGNMSIDFKLENKTRGEKEKASLDIFVEESGKDLLPYLSKSGGEKVKSSLSVILALSEIKSACAGIKLGMLFIDEPPFLDGDGIQAYCDALETIQNRYGGIKIMAITHDPTMKARFPQNLDVVKTENGSKIIC